MPRPIRTISLEFDPYVPWNRGILKGVEAFAQEHHEWHLLLHRMLPTGQIRMHGVHELTDGVISERGVVYADDRGLPQVGLGLGVPFKNVPVIYSDFRSVGRLAASHLIERGYGCLACFASYSNYEGDIERDLGFREAAGAENLPLTEVRLPPRREGEALTVGLLHLQVQLDAFCALPKPVGFFARNLTELYLAQHLIREADLRVPDEVGLIVGGNDRDMMEALKPSVTGISRNTYEIGYRAAETLQRLFEGKPVEPMVVVPPGGVIGRASTRLEAIGDEVVRRARGLIRERINGPIRLREIAREVGVSESSLRRRFRSALRRSPVEEVQRIRLERARELLENSELSVSEVSEQCGFAEPAQLSRAIKAETGLTPTALRNQSLRQRAEM